jgi:hypothetical protein
LGLAVLSETDPRSGDVASKDCCSDRDAEVHRVLSEKVFPRQATVITAAEFLAALGS